VFVYTDSADGVYEGDNTHANLVQSAGVISVAPQVFADLTVTGVTAPEGGAVGQQLFPAMECGQYRECWGPTPVNQWYDAVVLSQDAIYGNGDDRVLGRFLHDGALNRADSYTGSGSVTLPTDVGGDYSLFVVTDIYNWVYEFSYENNNGSSPAALTVNSPDLVIDAVSAPATAAVGRQTTITWTGATSGMRPPPTRGSTTMSFSVEMPPMATTTTGSSAPSGISARSAPGISIPVAAASPCPVM